jgi:hypothetical protein
MAASTARLRRANAAGISSDRASHSRVDPSTSASSNVTVPVGSATAKGYAGTAAAGRLTPAVIDEDVEGSLQA